MKEHISAGKRQTNQELIAIVIRRLDVLQTLFYFLVAASISRLFIAKGLFTKRSVGVVMIDNRWPLQHNMAVVYRE